MSEKIIPKAQYKTKVVRVSGQTEVICSMTLKAQEYDEQRDKDFGTGTYEDMCGVLNEMIKAYAGQYAHVGMVAQLSVDELKLHFTLKNREHAAIFIGRKAQHLQLVFNWLRAQQIYPHNRKIQVIITKEDERGPQQVQSFWDLNDGFWDRKPNRSKE